MPLVRRQVADQCDAGKATLARLEPNPANGFEQVAAVHLSSAIHQLGLIANYAAELFEELAATSTDIVQRSSRLTARIERLEGLLPKTKAVCDARLNKFQWNAHRVKWTKKLRVEDSQLFTKQSVPLSLQRVYDSVPSIPPIHLMDSHRDKDQPSCMMLYSYPEFFFHEWVRKREKEEKELAEGRKKKKSDGVSALVNKSSARPKKVAEVAVKKYDSQGNVIVEARVQPQELEAPPQQGAPQAPPQPLSNSSSPPPKPKIPQNTGSTTNMAAPPAAPQQPQQFARPQGSAPPIPTNGPPRPAGSAPPKPKSMPSADAGFLPPPPPMPQDSTDDVPPPPPPMDDVPPPPPPMDDGFGSDEAPPPPPPSDLDDIPPAPAFDYGNSAGDAPGFAYEPSTWTANDDLDGFGGYKKAASNSHLADDYSQQAGGDEGDLSMGMSFELPGTIAPPPTAEDAAFSAPAFSPPTAPPPPPMAAFAPPAAPPLPPMGKAPPMAPPMPPAGKGDDVIVAPSKVFDPRSDMLSQIKGGMALRKVEAAPKAAAPAAAAPTNSVAAILMRRIALEQSDDDDDDDDGDDDWDD
ncbi:hypothetical protein CAOG_06378 [Capsaspora owczarzaki ATCC 30864]|uniref:WH2 domain-containing protein n=1 Tax=Capsaspora owczarzaki (strain ATCC 30864) TaxID=595528 RepID=A0A0D2WV53_CAPO3|nr:hypothetical protein CAOG_06378 [Capsaspora owczarzaki ATCC 30864]KJE96003.1 hypothetical protein CAOG_006378 [Capsaspora owczarzaki ATCC 30864]|eukprot:XP_004345127.1 hypothetical protein CAOG_06378 [Capsaspora owczarzaki ATCC 30864]